MSTLLRLLFSLGRIAPGGLDDSCEFPCFLRCCCCCSSNNWSLFCSRFTNNELEETEDEELLLSLNSVLIILAAALLLLLLFVFEFMEDKVCLRLSSSSDITVMDMI